MEHRIERRKPRKYKGLHPKPNKTSSCKLTAIEHAFVAGACIAGSLSHKDCANLFGPRLASKSTITRTVQRVNKRALELNTTIITLAASDIRPTEVQKDSSMINNALKL
jgi:hypothetical protein